MNASREFALQSEVRQLRRAILEWADAHETGKPSDIDIGNRFLRYEAARIKKRQSDERGAT